MQQCDSQSSKTLRGCNFCRRKSPQVCSVLREQQLCFPTTTHILTEPCSSKLLAICTMKIQGFVRFWIQELWTRQYSLKKFHSAKWRNVMVGFLSATQSNVWSSARFLTQLWLFVIFQFCNLHHTHHHHYHHHPHPHLHRVRSISPGWSPSLLQDKVEKNSSNSSVTDTWTWKLTGFRRAAQLQNSHLQRHQRGLALWSALSVRKPHVQR